MAINEKYDFKPDYTVGVDAGNFEASDPTMDDIAASDINGVGDETCVRAAAEWAESKWSKVVNDCNNISTIMNAEDPEKRQQLVQSLGFDENSVMPLYQARTSFCVTAADWTAIMTEPDENLSPEQLQTKQILMAYGDLYTIDRYATDVNIEVSGVETSCKEIQLTVDNAYVKAKDLIDAQNFEDVNETLASIDVLVTDTIPSAVTTPQIGLDDASAALGQVNQVAQATMASFNSLVDDFNKEAAEEAFIKGQSLIDSITTKMLNVSENCLSILDQSKSITTNPSLSYKDKVQGLLTVSGVMNPDPSTSTTPILQPYENGFSGITGMNPIAAYGETLVSAFDDIDASSIASAISTGANATAKFIGRAFKGLTNGVAKLFNKIKKSTVSPDDLYTISKSSDPVIHNIGWCFQLDSSLSQSYKAYLSDEEYTIFSIAGSKIYLWVDENGIVKGVLKFPCAYNPYLNAYYDRIGNLINYQYTQYNWNTAPVDAARWAQSADNTWVDPSDDSTAVNAMYAAKKNFIIAACSLIYHSCSPLLCARYLGTSTPISTSVSNFRGAMDGKPINDIFDGVLTNFAYNDPQASSFSNSDIANEASYIFGHNQGGSYYTVTTQYNPASGSSAVFSCDALINGLVDVLCRYTANDWIKRTPDRNYDLSNYVITTWLPYYHDLSSNDGRYAVKTDSQNARTYVAFLAAFVIVTAAVLIGGHMVRTRLSAKKNIFKLEHGINTDSYHMEEALQGNADDVRKFFGKAGITDVHLDEYGTPDDPKQINKMLKFWRKDLRKRQRKLNRLQKITAVAPNSNTVDILSSKVLSNNSSDGVNIDCLYTVISGENPQV